MGEEFGAFRAFLFPTQTELVRFRQLVVNVSDCWFGQRLLHLSGIALFSYHFYLLSIYDSL